MWRGAALAWMLLMFWLSSRSDLPDPARLPEWIPVDKVAHLILFAVLAALFYLSGLRARWAVVAAALYGLSDEFHQMYVPGRSPDLRDWLADVVGAILGVWLVGYGLAAAARPRSPGSDAKRSADGEE